MNFPMTRAISKLLLLICLAGLSSQCRRSAPAAGEAGPAPLATVGDQRITKADLIQEAELRQANHQTVPPPADLLKEMVDRLSLVTRARAAGLAEEPETSRRIESLLIARLREQEIDPALEGLAVTEDEVRAAYDQRSEKYALNAMDRLSILYQEAPEKGSAARRDESKQRLESALARVSEEPVPGGRGPAANGFGAVAIEFSDDQTSRYRGGDLGWLDEKANLERIPAEVVKAGRSLPKGGRSGILETPQGFYVVMKTDSRGGGMQPYEEVAPALRQELLLEKRKAAEVKFVAESVERAHATMNFDAARRVELPTPRLARGSSDTPPEFPGVSVQSPAQPR